MENVLVSTINPVFALQNASKYLVIPTTCYDRKLDGDEAATDCGGSCAACGLGSTCVRRDDCGAGTCQAGKCARKYYRFYLLYRTHHNIQRYPQPVTTGNWMETRLPLIVVGHVQHADLVLLV